MNNIKNIFNKNEIENELKNFKEGQDYSIFPTDEPNIKTYNFHNDKLRSMFVGDKVPVRIAQETYDDKNYSYRGHFEEGKDYYYSHQVWEGNPPANEDGWRPVSREFKLEGNGDWTGVSMSFRPLRQKELLNDKEVEWHRKALIELEKDRKLYQDRIAGMSEHIAIAHPIEDEKGREHERELRDYEKTLDKINEKIRYHEDWLSKNTNGYNSNHSDLQRENDELRQQLAAVQRQLNEVLAELKKLKRDLSGQDKDKLDQQIIRNERLLENGEKVSLSEVQEQVNSSQALMKEFGVGVSTNQDNKNGRGALPYVIGGSVIVAAVALIGYGLVKKNKRKVR